MKLDQLVREALAQSGLKKAEVARLAEVSPSVVTRLTKGQRVGHLETVLRVTNVLKIDPSVVQRLVLGQTVISGTQSSADLLRQAQVAAQREREALEAQLREAQERAHLLEVQSSTHTHSAGEPTLIPGRPLIRLRIEESSVSAGAGSLAGDELLYQPEPGREGATHRAFRITGDCMEPEILAGDTVIVDTELPPEVGDVVVAVHDGDFLVKMLDQDETGWLLLAHDDRPAVRPNGETQVIGVVTDVQRRVKRGRKARRQ